MRIILPIIALIALPAAADPLIPLFIGNATQLFVDDVLVAQKNGVVRHAHACAKLPQPVLTAETPWEQDGEDKRVYLYGTVLRDPETGHFRMWYNRLDRVLFAESDDGLRWNRPNLGLHDWQGSSANNIVLSGLHSPSLVYNPDAADPNFRYALLGSAKGYWLYHSADGLRWTPCAGQPAIKGGDTCTLAYDPRTAEYLAFHKRTHEFRGASRRLVYLATSRDLKTWSEPILVMAPDEVDDAQVRREGGLYAQFYNMSAFPIAGQFLGFVTHFRYTASSETTEKGQSRHDGPIDVQLTLSRDGRVWSRCEDRSPVIPNGPYPYDAGCILGVGNGPVTVDDESWLYYTAISGTHGAPLAKKQISIALAKWRRDGFVSLDAGDQEGNIITVPFASSCGQLSINADIEGALRVAILDAERNPLAGYAYDDCLELNGDSIRHILRWKNHDRLPEKGSIRLAFYMKRAKLYSFTLTSEINPPATPNVVHAPST